MNKKIMLTMVFPLFVLLSTKTFAMTDVYAPFRAECAERVKSLSFVDQPLAFEYCLKGELARFEAAKGWPAWRWVWNWSLGRWVWNWNLGRWVPVGYTQ